MTDRPTPETFDQPTLELDDQLADRFESALEYTRDSIHEVADSDDGAPVDVIDALGRMLQRLGERKHNPRPGVRFQFAAPAEIQASVLALRAADRSIATDDRPTDDERADIRDDLAEVAARVAECHWKDEPFSGWPARTR